MTKHLMAVVFTLAVSTALVGCAGRINYPSYYTLNLPAPPDPPAAEGVRASVAIREFRSPAYLRQGSIVYKSSPEQIGFYNYDRWAVDPRDFLTNAVVDRLRASGTFSQVKLYDGRADIDYVLSGRLERLEEVDYDGGIQVQVAISAQMTRVATGETVWSNEAIEVGTVAQRNVPAVVSEMSRTMERTIDKLLTPAPAAAAK
ncbi:MAG TPA: ABC-type transport auxiliary lipoprotein family protein [Candidatus Eremiobacteraceae bacterium]|nr:ABC-type transport auxiliary lipoprotein family protein [Candidatus Eremiobacteraceae bacterium]